MILGLFFFICVLLAGFYVFFYARSINTSRYRHATGSQALWLEQDPDDNDPDDFWKRFCKKVWSYKFYIFSSIAVFSGLLIVYFSWPVIVVAGGHVNNWFGNLNLFGGNGAPGGGNLNNPGAPEVVPVVSTLVLGVLGCLSPGHILQSPGELLLNPHSPIITTWNMKMEGWNLTNEEAAQLNELFIQYVQQQVQAGSSVVLRLDTHSQRLVVLYEKAIFEQLPCYLQVGAIFYPTVSETVLLYDFLNSDIVQQSFQIPHYTFQELLAGVAWQRISECGVISYYFGQGEFDDVFEGFLSKFSDESKNVGVVQFYKDLRDAVEKIEDIEL